MRLKTNVKKIGWKKLAAGDILEAGSALNYHTGNWRSRRPVFEKKTCINCLKCWIFCPDAAIRIKNKKVFKIDLRYCKGCGICAVACPTNPKTIVMKNENQFKS